MTLGLCTAWSLETCPRYHRGGDCLREGLPKMRAVPKGHILVTYRTSWMALFLHTSLAGI